MAKEKDMNPNYLILKMTNHLISIGPLQKIICNIPSCFELGEKLRDVIVLR
jgi:hypothetical protein